MPAKIACVCHSSRKAQYKQALIIMSIAAPPARDAHGDWGQVFIKMCEMKK